MIPENMHGQLLETSRKLIELLRPESEEDVRIVQKGLMLYQQGMVRNRKLVGGSIWATVQDVTPVRIYISLSAPADSSCTCPEEAFCRHRMAAFLHAYSEIGSPTNWVEDWCGPLRERAAAGKAGLQRAKELMKTGGIPALDYDSWTQSFQETFRSVLSSYGRPTPYIISQLVQVYFRQVEASIPFKSEYSELYELVSAIEAFHLLTDLGEEQGFANEMVERFYGYVFDNLEDKIEESAYHLAQRSMPFEFDPFLERLAEDSGRFLLHPDLFSHACINIYRSLWSTLFRKTSWREKERDRLEKLMEGKTGFPEELALAHHYFLQRRDQEAIEVIRKAEQPALHYLLYWLKELKISDTKRMGPYIEYLVQQNKSYMNNLHDFIAVRFYVSHAFSLVSYYCNETGRVELLERMLVQSLPYSFNEYEYYVFEKGDFEKWVELYSYANFDEQALPTDKLKILQKENPAAMLPILHRAVDVLISQKNRSSYRLAVRHLKKLRTVYKKLKRVSEWEKFFGMLLTRNKRLRAFHEECVRGKLIHAE
ncbi:SWIM zinc finger family protein [Bacillus massilinigeriensis]|uniref:SWIM zinc finger family protein n=1 Tax=Bacillus mediterraneensis TaxID=1805474 RepID=UPI0008F92F62|nr:SWIM zinc finger family protein [Bacillus mediterraneensis]